MYIHLHIHHIIFFNCVPYLFIKYSATLGCSLPRARRGTLHCGKPRAAPLESLAALEEERVATEATSEEAEHARKEARTRLDKLPFALVKEEVEVAQLLFGSKEGLPN